MSYKIVVVGSSDGLGLALVNQLKDHHSCLIWGRDESKTSHVANNLQLPFVVADLCDYSLVEQAMESASSQLSGIDIVVNCVGVWSQGYLHDQSYELIQNIMQTNAIGSIWVAKTSFKFLRQSDNNPLLINVISQDGLSAKALRAAYTSSKFAMTGLTKSIQIDWQKYNIAVTGVYPGPFKSNLFIKAGVQRDFSQSLEVDTVATQISNLINQSEDRPQELII